MTSDLLGWVIVRPCNCAYSMSLSHFLYILDQSSNIPISRFASFTGNDDCTSSPHIPKALHFIAIVPPDYGSQPDTYP